MDSYAFCAESFIWDDHCGFEMTPGAAIGPLLEPWREGEMRHFSPATSRHLGRATATLANYQ